MNHSALDIAYKIINSQTDYEKGEVVTNLKLQKLLYYVQGFHLAFFNKPLFHEPLEAWMYGPVVPVVYRAFKNNGRGVLDPDKLGIKDKNVELSKKAENVFYQVMQEYGKFGAIKLMEMAHQERPWIEASHNSHDKKISLDTMKSFFSELIEA